MGNVSREMKTLRKKQKEMQEIKNTGTETKTTFDRLISRLDMAEKRIFELKAISTESFKTKKQREQRLKKTNRISKDCRITINTKSVT